jgi:hypothetical protein
VVSDRSTEDTDRFMRPQPRAVLVAFADAGAVMPKRSFKRVRRTVNAIDSLPQSRVIISYTKIIF